MIMGSWTCLNLVRAPGMQADVAIDNDIVALICAGEYQIALYCYGKAKMRLRKSNRYFQERIALARRMVGAEQDGRAPEKFFVKGIDKSVSRC